MNASELSQALTSARPALSDLRRVQAAYDLVGWRVSEPKTAKFRHICLHMMDVTAKLAMLAEHHDHLEDAGEPVSDDGLREQLHSQGLLAAEMLFSVLQVANLGGVDLGVALHDLYARNARVFAKDSEFVELEQEIYTDPLHIHGA